METPRQLGLPPRFTQWRYGQAEAIDKITSFQKSVFFLDAPTGIGKSLLAVGAYEKLTLIRKVLARMRGEEDHRFRCLYITRTKQLQNQLLTDFPDSATIQGRENYSCLLYPEKFPGFSAAHCLDEKSRPCPRNTECPYRRAKQKALAAHMAVLNDSYFLTEANGPGLFSGANMIILDECDSLEQALMGFICLEITERQLRQFNLPPPKKLDSIKDWLAWTENVRWTLQHQIGEKQRQLNDIPLAGWSDIEIEKKKTEVRASSFVKKLGEFDEIANESWLLTESFDKTGWRVSFKPVLVADYAQKYLWQHGETFLCMSGTILDDKIQAHSLGLEDWDYHRLDSPFPLGNRPIYYWPQARINRDNINESFKKIAEALQAIMDRYPNDRILVHTVSYPNRDRLLMLLAGEPRLVTHDREDREQKLEGFKHSELPLVMLSPSFDRGVDLPDDTCRCMVVVKIPYADLGDKQIKARLALPDGRRWYNLITIQTLMQMTGRAVRSQFDHADTWILDGAFDNLLAQTRHIIPKWWLDAIKRIDSEKQAG